MISFSGASALSNFRRAKMLLALQTVCPQCSDVSARYIHFADVNAPLDKNEHAILEKLLKYGPSLDKHTLEHATEFLSIPRIGTITPWSTKATDIAKHCSLDKVLRLERGILWQLTHDDDLQDDVLFEQIKTVLIDPMTETLLANPGTDLSQASQIFDHAEPAPFKTIDILGGGIDALRAANQSSGFALSDEEQHYLVNQFTALNRNPSDTELMMFAQVNSEHCRHKIFNADWTIDGEAQSRSPFKMIKHTHAENGANTLVAYHDNAAVIKGATAKRFFPNADGKQYEYSEEAIHIAIKVETHNHPTAISPFPGAATGAGGEIRDEGATGRGGKPKAGLAGFSVSHLRLPDMPRSWEQSLSSPSRIAEPLQIMLEGPIGSAAFNNEFGRPNLCGYFRTFEHSTVADSAEKTSRRGYHKPIMLAGGLGNIREQHIDKIEFDAGAVLIVLGGPAMLIGLGGGAASSMASGASSEDLDYASVQRGNPEMQRRCQEVIDTCWAMGDDNPILWIHDVGAGGLSNALPELVEDSGRSGHFNLRDILNDDLSMSPMQIWCNESQERYVMAVSPDRQADFEAMCTRERALYAIVGMATDDKKLVLEDTYFNTNGADQPHPIDLPMEVLFGLPPKMSIDATRLAPEKLALNLPDESIEHAVLNILRHPTVADKTFLISIGDRSITGLIAREQMVGPWQVPVADVAVTLSSFHANTGEAMALGERTPLALLDAPASGRMAIGEALTNIAAANISNIKDIKLSANWMVPAGEPGENANLYDTCHAIAMELCPTLGVSIPVGKDSMSMQTVWNSTDEKQSHKVVAPLSLIMTAFSPVNDARKTLTPEIQRQEDTSLWLLDLGANQNRLGGSIYAQTHGQLGDTPPDVDDPALLKGLFNFIQAANEQGLLLAYHDRSDGGLIAVLCEMAFTARCGLAIDLGNNIESSEAILFNEELGAVVQVSNQHGNALEILAKQHGIAHCLSNIGQHTDDYQINISHQGKPILNASRVDLHRAWSETTYKMQSLRDHPDCARQEYDRIVDTQDSGLFANTTFTLDAPMINTGTAPKMAILREQGVNGQIEMAAAFDRAGFDAIDVTMSDLAEGRQTLDNFQGFVACGGFSFGDVLGAGEGWAKSILFNQNLRTQFETYLASENNLALGVCNGCQMLASLAEIIPGTEDWPHFVRNRSEQFEARYVMTEIIESPSVFLKGMAGSQIPVAVAHGEGLAEFSSADAAKNFMASGRIGMRFVDNAGAVTEQYPANPNGSPKGITGITNDSGLVTLMMPHPERTQRTVNHSWAPKDWSELSPWMQLFFNARKHFN
ncbi:MAG: phosphoribosylformylglycinamidine synthase [Arenicellales bacterium]